MWRPLAEECTVPALVALLGALFAVDYQFDVPIERTWPVLLIALGALRAAAMLERRGER